MQKGEMTRKMVMLAAVVAVALGAWAATETVGGYAWTYRISAHLSLCVICACI